MEPEREVVCVPPPSRPDAPEHVWAEVSGKHWGGQEVSAGPSSSSGSVVGCYFGLMFDSRSSTPGPGPGPGPGRGQQRSPDLHSFYAVCKYVYFNILGWI